MPKDEASREDILRDFQMTYAKAGHILNQAQMMSIEPDGMVVSADVAALFVAASARWAAMTATFATAEDYLQATREGVDKMFKAMFDTERRAMEITGRTVPKPDVKETKH